jgi:carboxypeptidase PM20D1
MIKRLLIGLLALVLVLAAVLVANTLRQGSRQLAVPPLAPLAVDEAGVVQTMAAAVRARTVSGLLDPAGTAAEFDTLHALLKARTRLVHAKLHARGGGQPQPAVHLEGQRRAGPAGRADGAPGRGAHRPRHRGAVEEAALRRRGGRRLRLGPRHAGRQEQPRHPARGAGDAAEGRLQPRRTIYFVFGHDEEVGGARGAKPIVALLKQRGVRLEWVLDEGLAVTEGVMPGVAQPVALIGLAEKGSVSLKLTPPPRPGHSSMPPGPGGSAIGMLSQALAKLDRSPLPGGIQGAAAEMFAAVAPELPFGQRLALSNLWLTRPLVERQLAQGASTNAMMRTTTAMTMLNAGNKDNVLPGQWPRRWSTSASCPATRSSRCRPSSSRPSPTIASNVSCRWAWASTRRACRAADRGVPLVERTVREVFPDSIVAPGLMLAASDARHFDGISDASFRFMPIRFNNPDDLKRPHGTDERIATKQLADMVRFYHRLLQQAAAPRPTDTPRRKQAMSQAVIVSTARTPLAKSWKGAFNMTHGATLGGHAIKARSSAPASTAPRSTTCSWAAPTPKAPPAPTSRARRCCAPGCPSPPAA